MWECSVGYPVGSRIESRSGFAAQRPQNTIVLLLRGDRIMPLNPDGSKKNEKPAAPSTRAAAMRGASNPQFVDYPLTKEERDEVKTIPVDADLFLAEMDKWLVRGYAFRAVRDDRNACFALQVYAPKEGDANSGLALVGRGSSFVKALRQFLYITHALGDKWSTLDFRARSGEDYDD